MRKTMRTIWAVAALAVLCCAAAMAPGRALAQSEHTSILRITDAGQLPAKRNVKVGLSKSMIVEVPRAVGEVLTSDPEVLDVVVKTSTRAYLIGSSSGQANAFFFDKDGERMLTLEVVVDRDPAPLERLLNRLIPKADIKIEFINDTVVLTGSVSNPSDSSRASDIASRFMVSESPQQDVKNKKKVINLLTTGAKEQVYLKVTVAEMERNIIKQLGINWDGNYSIGSSTLGFGSNPGFAINETLQNIIDPLAPTQTQIGGNGIGANIAGGDGSTVANLRALERNGLIRTLAEPTLTAISGETANFLAGGEFPIPVAEDDGKISIEFKPFGVGLSFTPVVMSEGLISMKVSTEVSELSDEEAVVLSNTTIPSLKVRRANTTIELPSGGSLVIAGLISDETRQSIEGLPGLKNLPVLGTLFRSRDYVKSETELVVIVTPYMAKPAARKDLARPDDGFAPASDAKANLLGRQNRVYEREPEKVPLGKYRGDYGFIVD